MPEVNMLMEAVLAAKDATIKEASRQLMKAHARIDKLERVVKALERDEPNRRYILHDDVAAVHGADVKAL